MNRVVRRVPLRAANPEKLAPKPETLNPKPSKP